MRYELNCMFSFINILYFIMTSLLIILITFTKTSCLYVITYSSCIPLSKSRYEDERHNDFIRGLAWKDGNTLFTCGWDKAVHEHTTSN